MPRPFGQSLQRLCSQAALMLACLWASKGTSQAQSARPGDSTEFVLHVIERDQGLPHNTVSGLAQTRDGYLWVGTHEGLARFDGHKFVVFKSADTPGLDSDHIDTLSTDVYGSLWIGVERGGVSRLREGVMERLAPLSAYTNRIDTITPDGPDHAWVGFSQGRLLKWARSGWHTFSTGNGLPAQGRVFSQLDVDGRLWFASDNSFGYFESGDCVILASNRLEYFRIANSRESGVWLAHAGILQRILPSLEVDVFETETVAGLETLGNSGIEVLYEDSRGALWLGTRGNGLFRFVDGEFTRVPTSHDFILTICEDQEGDIWVGTWGGGLNRLQPKLVNVYGTDEGLTKSLLQSLCEDERGAIWIAARGASPASISPDRSRINTARRGLLPNSANVLCPDRDGGIWIAAEQKGLFHLRGGVCTTNGFQGTFIMSLHQDSKTNLWIGTLREGLFQWSPGKNPIRRGGDELREITAIAEDLDGNIWVGTQQGSLHRWDPNSEAFTVFTETNNLPGQKAQVIYADGPNSLWIGTRGGGLLRWRDGAFSRITESRGIPDDDIRQIELDDSGGIWVGTASGLFRTRRTDLEAAAKDSTIAVECVSFGKSYGLDNFEFVEGFRNASCKTQDGHLWFATTRGAVEVNPSRDIVQQVPPAVHIEEITVDGRPIRMGGGEQVEIPPDSGRVEIKFTATSFSAPENIRFRHRLENVEEDWVETGSQRSVTYFRMTPGDYRFCVIARGSSGTWNRVGANIAFRVKPTLWETLWFRIAVIAASTLIIGIAVRIILLRRMRHRLRELEQAQALENERRRIARDMHDELGANLTRLALMSEQIRRHPTLDPEARVKANRVSETAAEVAHTLDQIVWTVNPGNDSLERLIGYLSHYATDFLAATPIRVTQELPQLSQDHNIQSDVRHQLFLTFKEALNNAVKHSGATEIKLRIWIERQTLNVAIEDNGKGFQLAEEKHKGEGLTTLTSRLQHVGGSCRIESEPAAGTKVFMSLPLSGSA